MGGYAAPQMDSDAGNLLIATPHSGILNPWASVSLNPHLGKGLYNQPLQPPYVISNSGDRKDRIAHNLAGAVKSCFAASVYFHDFNSLLLIELLAHAKLFRLGAPTESYHRIMLQKKKRPGTVSALHLVSQQLLDKQPFPVRHQAQVDNPHNLIVEHPAGLASPSRQQGAGVSYRVLYFAYGSNMNLDWVSERCPGIKPLGKAKLDGYAVGFRYPSTSWPGGGACDILPSEGKVVWGAIYEITPEHLKTLDQCEDLHLGGYRRIDVQVDVDGKQLQAVSYEVIDKLPQDMKPVPGYLQLLLTGAAQHDLPPEYQRHLQVLGLTF